MKLIKILKNAIGPLRMMHFSAQICSIRTLFNSCKTFICNWQSTLIFLTDVEALPSILNFEKDKERLERLNEENRELRVQMMTLQGEIVSLQTEKRNGKKSIAVQTNSVSLGDECDYLVVNTK